MCLKLASGWLYFLISLLYKSANSAHPIRKTKSLNIQFHRPLLFYTIAYLPFAKYINLPAACLRSAGYIFKYGQGLP